MRWRRTQFALFAVAALAVAVAPPAPARAQEADPVETTTSLTWRGQDGRLQPAGDTTFYVVVAAKSGSARPVGTVEVKADVDARVWTLELKHDDTTNSRAKFTDDFTANLGNVPHYFTATFKPQSNDAFVGSEDEMGLGIGALDASPEPSSTGELVTYKFTLDITDKTPVNRRPKGVVSFGDTANSFNAKVAPVPGNDLQFVAFWRFTYQASDRFTVTAVYSPDDGGGEFFQPIVLTGEHVVRAASSPAGTVRTTTTRRTVTTRGARGALSPINASTSTSLGDGGSSTTTSVTFGAFPTTPPATSDLSAAGEGDDDGPPILVVVSTLGALGVLGTIAALRRYRRSAVDWF